MKAGPPAEIETDLEKLLEAESEEDAAEGGGQEPDPSGGYDPSHPWYYKLGGKPPAVSEIMPSEQTVEWWLNSFRATMKRPNRAKMKAEHDAAVRQLGHSIRSYRELTGQGRQAEGEDELSCSDWDSEISLTHNHIYSGRARIKAYLRLMAELPEETKSEKKGKAPKTSKQAIPDPAPARACRVCGCTEADCRRCIEKTGEPCEWVEFDLCSACVEPTAAASDWSKGAGRFTVDRMLKGMTEEYLIQVTQDDDTDAAWCVTITPPDGEPIELLVDEDTANATPLDVFISGEIDKLIAGRKAAAKGKAPRPSAEEKASAKLAKSEADRKVHEALKELGIHDCPKAPPEPAWGVPCKFLVDGKRGELRGRWEVELLPEDQGLGFPVLIGWPSGLGFPQGGMTTQVIVQGSATNWPPRRWAEMKIAVELAQLEKNLAEEAERKRAADPELLINQTDEQLDAAIATAEKQATPQADPEPAWGVPSTFTVGVMLRIGASAIVRVTMIEDAPDADFYGCVFAYPFDAIQAYEKIPKTTATTIGPREWATRIACLRYKVDPDGQGGRGGIFRDGPRKLQDKPAPTDERGNSVLFNVAKYTETEKALSRALLHDTGKPGATKDPLARWNRRRRDGLSDEDLGSAIATEFKAWHPGSTDKDRTFSLGRGKTGQAFWLGRPVGPALLKDQGLIDKVRELFDIPKPPPPKKRVRPSRAKAKAVTS